MRSRRKEDAMMKDEVEELLKAAEDEIILKLSIDSHASRISPSYIEPDLDRRFQALKNPSSETAYPSSNTRPSPENAKHSSADSKSEESSRPTTDDDLLARFAALKASLPSSSSLSLSREVDDSRSSNDDDNKEDEVEKVIKWAIDAARLDPSPPTDDENSDDSDSENNGDDCEKIRNEVKSKDTKKLKERK